ncbi:hypothetical protein QOT17_005950 [Balamuthia mandrillaris]
MGNAAGRTTQAKKTSDKEDGGGHASAKQAQSAPKGWPSRVQRGARDNKVLRRVGEAVQQVPLELWVIIFENLFSSFQHDLDALSDLQNCIRVCSAWHEGVLMGGGSRILRKARHQKEEAELWQHLEQQVQPRSTTLLLPRHAWEDEGYARRRLYVWMRMTEAHNPTQSGSRFSSQSQKQQESVPVRKKEDKDGEEAAKESEALHPFEDDPEVKRKRLLRWYGLTDTKEEGNGKEEEGEEEGGPVLSVLLAGLPASGKSSVLYYLKHGQPAPQPPDDGGTTHVEEAVLGDHHRMLFLESRGSSYGFPFNSEVLSLLYVVDLTRPKHLTEKQMAARKTELEHLQDLLKQQESNQQAKSKKAKHKQLANAFLDDWEGESTPKWGPENKFFPCWSGHPSYSLAEESRLRHELYYDFHSVCGHGNQKRIRVAVLCNKVDLLTEEEAKAAMSDIEQHLRLDALWTCSWYTLCVARTFAVSAKTGHGLDHAIRWLVGESKASRS